MISEKYLALKGIDTVPDFYQQTTEYYVTGKYTQASNNIMVMSKPQIKEYFFLVLDLYPDNREFLEFIFAMI